MTYPLVISILDLQTPSLLGLSLLLFALSDSSSGAQFWATHAGSAEIQDRGDTYVLILLACWCLVL